MHKSFCSKIRKLLVYEVSWVNDLCIAGFLLEEYKKLPSMQRAKLSGLMGDSKSTNKVNFFAGLCPNFLFAENQKLYSKDCIRIHSNFEILWHISLHSFEMFFDAWNRKECKYEIKVRIQKSFHEIWFQLVFMKRWDLKVRG